MKTLVHLFILLPESSDQLSLEHAVLRHLALDQVLVESHSSSVLPIFNCWSTSNSVHASRRETGALVASKARMIVALIEVHRSAVPVLGWTATRWHTMAYIVACEAGRGIVCHLNSPFGLVLFDLDLIFMRLVWPVIL